MPAEDFIRSELLKLDPKWGIKKSQLDSKTPKIKIRCPFHANGKERTPSFIINITKSGKFWPGNGHCFGCGKKTKTWNELAAKLGRPGYNYDEDDQPSEIFDTILARTLLNSEDTVGHLPNTDEMIDWENTIPWRTISGRLVRRIGGKLMFNHLTSYRQLYLPCSVMGNIVGGISANIKKTGKNNYFNTPGEWVKQQGLFPFDHVRKMLKKKQLNTLVLEEGPRDALKSIQYGIPALAILGSNNWSDMKAELIFSLGISHLITAFDPDAAGISATKLVYKSLKNEIIINRFKFAENTDPANASRDVMLRLKSHVYRANK